MVTGPIDEIQVEPCLVVVALISRSQTKSSSQDGERTVHAHLPISTGAWWFEKSTDVCPVVRNGSRSPRWCDAQWRMQGTVSKGFVNSTEVVSASASPRSTIEITCNQVNLLRNHDSTNSEDELLGNTSFLCIYVAYTQRHNCTPLA